jgi:hypothetical protein
MKSFKFIIVGLILVTIGFAALFVVEMAKTPKLIEQKHERENIIGEAQSAKKKLEKFKSDSNELKDADDYVKKMVLADEASALAAIREMSLLAEKDGLKGLEIRYVNPDSGAQPGDVGAGSDLPRSMGLVRSKVVFVSAQFESDFVSLLKYLKDIYALKAASSVEQVAISRDEKIMPLQRMRLSLALYIY